MARTRLYRNGVLEKENFPVADISECVNDPGAVVWLDMCTLDGDAGLDDVEEEFGLHALAIEDAAHERQRPKLDHYGTHLFISAYAIAMDPETTDLESSELAMFVMPNALITVRKDRNFDIDEVVKRWDATPELVKEGAGFLLYGVLDYIVDGHFQAVQDLDERIESLQDELFDDSRDRVREVQRKSFDLRRDLILLRRFVLPMREVVNALMRRDIKVVNDTLMPYYQDVYDHVLRATEWTESLRDLVSTVSRNEPDDSGQPDEPHHEAGHQLGRDHRGANCSDRLLRPERAVPRLREPLRAYSRRRSSSCSVRARCIGSSAAKTGCRTYEPPPWKMLTAREITNATVTSEIPDCARNVAFAQCESGNVSVGLNAVALVKEVNK